MYRGAELLFIHMEADAVGVTLDEYRQRQHIIPTDVMVIRAALLPGSAPIGTVTSEPLAGAPWHEADTGSLGRGFCHEFGIAMGQARPPPVQPSWLILACLHQPKCFAPPGSDQSYFQQGWPRMRGRRLSRGAPGAPTQQGGEGSASPLPSESRHPTADGQLRP